MWIEKDIPENLNNKDKELFRAYVGFANDYISYFGQYEKTVDIITKYIYETKTNSTEICHPLLYLIRHSMELGLKANIYFLNELSSIENHSVLYSHNIRVLFSSLEKSFYDLCRNDKVNPLRIEKFKNDSSIIKELIDVLGEEASVFRYPVNPKDKLLFDRTDIVIDILALSKKYKVASDLLSGLANTIWFNQQRT